MITDYAIEKVKSIPISEVVSQYVVLKKRGASYLGLCPLHSERTPSFTVNPARNIFKCFGCGAGGDGIKFIMELEGKPFIEAIQLLAEQHDIPLHIEPGNHTTNLPVTLPVSKENIFSILPSAEMNWQSEGIYGNPLTQRFCTVFGSEVVSEVLALYKLGIDRDWLIYPQIDYSGNLRTAKAIKYTNLGHRDTSFFPRWLHTSLLKKGFIASSFQLKQCLTGEHLISSQPSKKVAIVEGQSSMLFMACLGVAARKYKITSLQYFDQFSWVCTGGADGIGWKTPGLLEKLKHRDIILFPDAGFYDAWCKDAGKLQEQGLSVGVSDFLEKKYVKGEVEKNADLRDYFKPFLKEIKQTCSPVIEVGEIACMPSRIKNERYPGIWEDSVILKSGVEYFIPCDEDACPILEHPNLSLFARHYNRTYLPGSIDGIPCLLAIHKN